MTVRRQGGTYISKVYITSIAITVVTLLTVFIVHSYKLRQIAPVYEMKAENITAQTPSEAQAECRGDHDRFAEAMQGYDGCKWVWTGEETLYLVKPESLQIDADAENTGFTAVQFKDDKGRQKEGYIIEPETEPAELGRIKIDSEQDYTFENVSMTVRVGIRSGDINFDNAVYLWEKDTDTVLAARPDTYKIIEGSIVNFVDDGNIAHTCYILDTKID